MSETHYKVTIDPEKINFRQFRFVTNPDGTESYVEMTREEIVADLAEGRRKEAERIAAGGCPHTDWDHHYDGNDYYLCAACGELMQVG